MLTPHTIKTIVSDRNAMPGFGELSFEDLLVNLIVLRIIRKFTVSFNLEACTKGEMVPQQPKSILSERIQSQ